MQTKTTGKTKKGAYTTSGQATSRFLRSGDAADGTDEAPGPASLFTCSGSRPTPNTTVRTAHTSADHAGRDVVCV